MMFAAQPMPFVRRRERVPETLFVVILRQRKKKMALPRGTPPGLANAPKISWYLSAASFYAGAVAQLILGLVSFRQI